MTVGELIQILKGFDPNLYVGICGGEGSSGDFGYLEVGQFNERTCYNIYGQPYIWPELINTVTILDQDDLDY